jgi:hypothetical protein
MASFYHPQAVSLQAFRGPCLPLIAGALKKRHGRRLSFEKGHIFVKRFDLQTP